MVLNSISIISVRHMISLLVEAQSRSATTPGDWPVAIENRSPELQVTHSDKSSLAMKKNLTGSEAPQSTGRDIANDCKLCRLHQGGLENLESEEFTLRHVHNKVTINFGNVPNRFKCKSLVKWSFNFDFDLEVIYILYNMYIYTIYIIYVLYIDLYQKSLVPGGEWMPFPQTSHPIFPKNQERSPPWPQAAPSSRAAVHRAKAFLWLFICGFYKCYMGVSKNKGTPKWMVDNGKPY